MSLPFLPQFCVVSGDGYSRQGGETHVTQDAVLRTFEFDVTIADCFDRSLEQISLFTNRGKRRMQSDWLRVGVRNSSRYSDSST